MDIQAIHVENITNTRGNKIANQFVIRVRSTGDKNQVAPDEIYFQSYASMIAKKDYKGNITLDENKWDYSVTTGKYRNQFLGEDKKTTEAKIKSGQYKLVNLN